MRLPSSPCDWEQRATWRVYEKLGIKGKVIPKSMHGEFRIDGWDIVLKRSAAKGRSGRPRLFVRIDGRLVDLGRLRQTLCRPDVHQSRKKAKRQKRDPRGRFIW
jgi:hypothetical protein